MFVFLVHIFRFSSTWSDCKVNNAGIICSYDSPWPPGTNFENHYPYNVLARSSLRNERVRGTDILSQVNLG